MRYDENKVDDAVLALMFLTLHDGGRSWKGFDWSALDRLYEKGLISDPQGKARSVVLTDEGLTRSELLFNMLFVNTDHTAPVPPYWTPTNAVVDATGGPRLTDNGRRKSND